MGAFVVRTPTARSHTQGTSRTHLPSSYQVFVEFIGRERRFSNINA